MGSNEPVYVYGCIFRLVLVFLDSCVLKQKIAPMIHERERNGESLLQNRKALLRMDQTAHKSPDTSYVI